jgi:enoyl-CoA hydratase/carnithine racemase
MMDSTMENDQLILRSDEDGIAVLTLNSPKSINALSESMLTAMSEILDDIAVDRSVKVVILRSGGNHFCAGHNLKEMTARRADEDGGFQYFQDLFAKCSAMMLRVVRLPQPVIAEVKGIATAAGCQLVASCDLAVSAEDAKFATSGVNIGLFCSTPMVALARNVPRKLAMEMLLLGEFLPALIIALLIISIFIYLLLAMFRFYKQGFLKTIIKFFILNFSYTFLVFIFFLITLSISFLLF